MIQIFVQYKIRCANLRTFLFSLSNSNVARNMFKFRSCEEFKDMVVAVLLIPFQ